VNTSRIARVVANMRERGLHQILVTAPASVYYLTGTWVEPSERMLALLVTTEGEATLFTNRLFALGGRGLPLIEHGDTDDCVKLLCERLSPGLIGIDKQWPSLFTLRMMEARPDLRPALGSEPVDRARMIKDADELHLLRESSRGNDRALEQVIRSLAPGMTELEAVEAYARAAKSQGASLGFQPLICFGANGAEPHHEPDATRLAEGDAVVLDVGLRLAGGLSDMTRTVVSRVSAKQREVYELVREANEAGRAAVRPGVPLCEIDRAARQVIERGGYGECFTHRTGHGLGLEIHEPPDVSAACEVVAEPGMVFSIEPGIYLPGEFGVRIEDLVAVTEGGCETLNQLPRGMREIS